MPQTVEKNKKSIKAASWYTVTNFLSKVIIYILTPLFTRLLTEGEYGQYSNFISWQSVLVVVFSLDLNSTVAVAYIDYEKKEFEEYISSIAFFSLIIPAFFSFIIVLFNDTFSSIMSMDKIYLYIMAASICLYSALYIFQAEQRSKIEYKLSSSLMLLSSIGTTVLTLIFAFCFKDKLLAIIIGSFAVNIVINIVIYAYYFSRNFHLRFEYFKYAMVLALPLVPHIVSSTLLGSSDKIMIMDFCGEEQTAYYSLIYLFAMVVTLFITSINNAWVPWFFDRMKEKDYFTINKIVKVTIPVIGLIALVICLIAPEVLIVFGKEGYRNAVKIMPPILTGCIFRYVYTLYVNIEFFEKKTAGISVATVVTAAINIGLNYLLIPRFGYMAAAYTTLLANVLMLFIHMYVVRRLERMDVFNNKMNIIMALGFSILCMLVIFLYESIWIRYAILGVLVALICVLSIKNKETVAKVVKMIVR